VTILKVLYLMQGTFSLLSLYPYKAKFRLKTNTHHNNFLSQQSQVSNKAIQQRHKKCVASVNGNAKLASTPCLSHQGSLDRSGSCTVSIEPPRQYFNIPMHVLITLRWLSRIE